MKRTIPLLITLLLFVLLSLTACTPTTQVVNLSDHLLSIKSSYQNKTDLTLFEETVAMASMNWMQDRTAFYPESDGTAKTLAKRVIAFSATASAPEQFPEVDQLASLQEGDGSFGNLETHCYAMIALASMKKNYNSPKAYEYLLALQQEDGSFGTTIKETALAITVLSLSTENATEKGACDRALEYLARTTVTELPDLCWKLIGLSDAAGTRVLDTGGMTCLERLQAYKTANGGYAITAGGTESDAEATALVLLAIDAANMEQSAFKRLATVGLMKTYSIEDFYPFFTLLGIFLFLALIFWIFVFVHKKPNKTLEETKLY